PLCRLEQVPEQGGRGALAIGSSDRHHWSRDETQSELELSNHRDTGSLCGRELGKCRHPWRNHDEIGFREIDARVSSQHELDVEPPKLVRELAGRSAIGTDDACPPFQAKPCRAEATLAQADDNHSFALQIHQRTFNEAKLTRASRKEMIQKRTMMRGSGHPFFSKW